jgi:glucosyltransferase
MLQRAGNRQSFYDAVSKVLSGMKMDHEILFVNDGSRDNTLAEILKLHEAHPGEVKVIDFSRNFGKEGAFSPA